MRAPTRLVSLRAIEGYAVFALLFACSSSKGGGGSDADASAQGGSSGAGSGGAAGMSAPGGASGMDAGTSPLTDAGLDAGGGTSNMPDAAVDIDAALSAPLDFGPNVLIFDSGMSMTDIQSQIDATFTSQGGTQFSTDRRSFFFKPGQYALDVRLGYYTQALGLGQSPDDVVITGAVRSTGNMSGNATLSFWRGAENLSVVPMPSQTDMWAVSQGTTFRRMHVQGSLVLADSGNSSGGFLADTKIDGQVSSASQQQWLSRNAEWGGWAGGVWNMVFVGVTPAPTGTWPGSPFTVVDNTPEIEEKPFLTFDAASGYGVVVPSARSDSQGISWGAAPTASTTIPIDQFYVAHPEHDTAAILNAVLRAGKHLLFTPGIYHLESSITVTRPGTILLGLGLATLLPDTGTPAISIADVDGVKVAGLILDAGPSDSATLLEVGPTGSARSHALAPTYLYDLSCRIGGGEAGLASSCVTINSSNVVGDNLWLWRADHGAGAGWTKNLSDHGLTVNGNDVTIYGLFVEHFQGYQTQWNGNGGRVYFYQSELPYDPPSQADWQHDGVNGYASYKVADTVTSHDARGVGIYCAFRQPVVEDNAIETPVAAGVTMQHLVTVWLNGMATSSIEHVINGTGDAATQANRRVTAN